MQSGFQGSLYGSSIKSQFAEVRRKGFGARHSNCMSQMHAKVLDDAIHLFFGHRFALSCSPDADIKDFRPPCPGDCLNRRSGPLVCPMLAARANHFQLPCQKQKRRPTAGRNTAGANKFPMTRAASTETAPTRWQSRGHGFPMLLGMPYPPLATASRPTFTAARQ